ncbi:MAG: acetylxylan esterase [Kiritimatiellia bacterium]
MKKLLTLLLTGVFVVSLSAGTVEKKPIESASGIQLLDETIAGGKPELMLHRVLMAEIRDCGDKIRKTQDGLTTREKLTAWQKRIRQDCLQALGEFPERTPLNARITEKVQREGYRIEKLIFESRPGFFVTALLFLPDEKKFKPPYPGIVVACGHSSNGKGLSGYQRGSLMAAVNGMAALIYDPVDQGERRQGVGHGGTTGHNTMGVKAALLGWNTANFRIWDGMRALDYLVSRPEIDPDRIGCMGNSGGGTLSAYISALDDRVKAASPSCYISSLQAVCASIGPQDAEQNIFGQMTFGLEHSGWLLLRALKPTCVCSAEKDFFPVEAARQSVQEVRTVYSFFNQEEKIKQVFNDGPHGWVEPLRVGAVTFMSKWLKQSSDVSFPPLDETGLEKENVHVTKDGQVMQIEGARSVYDIMRDEAARLRNVRMMNSRQRNLQECVRRRAGIRSLADLPVPVTVNRGAETKKNITVRKVVLTSQGRTALPAVFSMPDSPEAEPVLVVSGKGKQADADKVSALLAKGHPVMAADLSGFGETYGCIKKFYRSGNKDEGPAVMAYLLGHSLVGIRAEDIIICAQWLTAACGRNRVKLQAAEWAVTPALHAMVAEPQLFSAISLSEEPPTWEEIVVKDVKHRFADIVHGALQEYTIGDLKQKVSSPVAGG